VQTPTTRWFSSKNCQMSSRTGCGWAYPKVLTSVFGLLAPVTRKSSANWCFHTVSKLVFSCHSGRFYSLSSFWVTMSIEVSTFLWINAHCEWLMFFLKSNSSGPARCETVSKGTEFVQWSTMTIQNVPSTRL
jgi:hypothetical protein